MFFYLEKMSIFEKIINVKKGYERKIRTRIFD